jgi:hypothetical protein
MRLVGTAAVCAALAFGAAFLVGRAVHNGSSDRGGYKLASATISHLPRSNNQLASEFAPESKAGKLRIVKVHHRAKPKTHHASNTHSPSTGTGSPATPSTDTTPSDTAPTYTPPATTTHPSSSGQGSGTTSVGGSSSKKKSSGSGSGVTSVGGG